MNESIALSLMGTHRRRPQSPSAAEKPPETAWEKNDFSSPPTVPTDASYWPNATGRLLAKDAGQCSLRVQPHNEE